MQRAMQKPDPTWFAFLAMAFLVVGLTGLFASYAAPLPLARALARDAALDAAQEALAAPDPAAALEALRPRLGDSAAALLPAGGDMPARIAAERRAMHARLEAEADATASRLRMLIMVVTVMAGAFGAVILGAARGRAGMR
jgi:hypothetical protein